MSSGAGEAKLALRRELRARREALPAGERARVDGAIARRVAGLPEFSRAEVVLTYLSFGAEVDTREVIRLAWEAGKAVALPRCVPGTREMRWFAVRDLGHLVRSRFGVEEPVPDAATEVLPADAAEGRPMLALVPGLSFDAAGYRIGYGGGYYDRFLASFSGVSVGLCREAFLARPGTLPLDAHDLPVDLVVTEAGMRRPAGSAR